MQLVRTQIYLEPEQHRSLKAEAQRRGISLAQLLRQLVDESLVRPRPRGDLSRIVGLWDSGGSDVARHKDEYIAQAIAEHHGRQ
ncbi:MAG: CopG family transcriptional regulator [Chloroflexota bacterium]